MNRFFECEVMIFIVKTEIGTVKIVISASNGEIEIIMITTPMIVSVEVSIMLSVCWRLCATLSMSLVTRLKRSPRGVPSTYESGSRLSLSSTSLRSLCIERWTTPARMKLWVYGGRGGDVDQQRLQQHPVQFAEVDSLRALDTGDDDVGGIAEDPRPDDGEGDADEREQQHRGDPQPFRCHAVQQPPDDIAEVLRPLDRHPDAEAGTRVHRDALARLRNLLLLALLPVGRGAAAVRGHATSSTTNWDSTISW